uniref:Histidine N-acetyltransferase C-terminal domain-containing protein n=1 Tax=Salarias fasciatus TaxID=181472 RepID=A0A672FY09_SALFA
MDGGELVYSLAEEQDFHSSDYGGLDYMSAFYPRWMQEPGRLVFIGRISGFCLEVVCDRVVQGLRVVPDLRGRGIAGAIQRHVAAHVRQHYPEVRAVRLTRGEAPTPETLTKYRVIAKEVGSSAILSLCCEAAHLGPFIAELRSKLARESESSLGGPLTLSREQAETLILTRHVVSNLLPGETIISDWEPLKPLEANLEVLRRRGLTWIVDRESEPKALGLGTPPYAVPYRHDALRININIFGRSLASVSAVFLAQLEAFLPSLRGYLIIYTYVDPEVWSGLRQFCENNANVSFFKDYWEDYVLETDI